MSTYTSVAPNSTIVQCDESRLVFHRSLGDRTLGLFGGAAFLVGSLLALGAGVSLLSSAKRLGYLGPVMFVFIALVAAVIGLGFLASACPTLMDCDLKQRTYRFRRGWSFFPQTRTGALSDFKSVKVVSVRQAAGKLAYFITPPMDHRVYMVWNKAPTVFGFIPVSYLQVANLAERGAAEQWGYEISKMLGLPIEIGPFLG